MARSHGPDLSILLVDDEADSLLPALAQHLEPLGIRMSKESRATSALDAVSRLRPDAVLLDLHFPGDDDRSRHHRTTGGRLLAALRARFPELPVLIFTTRLDDPDIPAEEFGIKPTARIAKPDFEAGPAWALPLALALRQAIEASNVEAGRFPSGWQGVLGTSASIRELARQAQAAARTDLSLLLEGERGTGRRTVAHAIHRMAGRTGAFVVVDCAAGDDARLDDASRRGGDSSAEARLLTKASGGTICVLDAEQVAEPRLAQLMARLWPVQDPVDRPERARPGLRPRIIVCVEEAAVQASAGRLLSRFFELAAEMRIRVPPLRERLSDLPDLFATFVDRANTRTGKHVLTLLRPEALAMLEGHAWPGNLKELENCILSAVAQTQSNVLLPEDFRLPVGAGTTSRALSPGQGKRSPEHSTYEAPAAIPDGVQALTDELECVRPELRYAYLNQHIKGPLRASVLTEFVRRVRVRLGRRVTHKVLAEELCGEGLMDKDYNRIRKAVTEHIKLSDFD